MVWAFYRSFTPFRPDRNVLSKWGSPATTIASGPIVKANKLMPLSMGLLPFVLGSLLFVQGLLLSTAVIGFERI